MAVDPIGVAGLVLAAITIVMGLSLPWYIATRLPPARLEEIDNTLGDVDAYFRRLEKRGQVVENSEHVKGQFHAFRNERYETLCIKVEEEWNRVPWPRRLVRLGSWKLFWDCSVLVEDIAIVRRDIHHYPRAGPSSLNDPAANSYPPSQTLSGTGDLIVPSSFARSSGTPSSSPDPLSLNDPAADPHPSSPTIPGTSNPAVPSSSARSPRAPSYSPDSLSLENMKPLPPDEADFQSSPTFDGVDPVLPESSAHSTVGIGSNSSPAIPSSLKTTIASGDDVPEAADTAVAFDVRASENLELKETQTDLERTSTSRSAPHRAAGARSRRQQQAKAASPASQGKKQFAIDAAAAMSGEMDTSIRAKVGRPVLHAHTSGVEANQTDITRRVVGTTAISMGLNQNPEGGITPKLKRRGGKAKKSVKKESEE